MSRPQIDFTSEKDRKKDKQVSACMWSRVSKVFCVFFCRQEICANHGPTRGKICGAVPLSERPRLSTAVHFSRHLRPQKMKSDTTRWPVGLSKQICGRWVGKKIL